MTPENFAIIHAKEQNEIMLNEDSFDEEIENSEEDDENNSENFEENNDEEMNEDENDEDMDQEDEDSEEDEEDDTNGHDNMEEDDNSESEAIVPVELEDFEKLLQSKELVMKSIRRTQKQNNGEDMDQYNSEDSVEDIWKPVHQGFGTGIGVLLNGQLPNLDLPAELDELKGGTSISV